MALIALVDDEQAVTATLRLFLTERGHSVSAYNSPRHALTAIVQQPVEPDIIFTDMRMPDMQGTELLQKLREAGITSEVIVVTAFAQDEHALRALELGAYDYITKPYRLEEIQFLVGRALEKRRIKAENQALKDQSPDVLFRSEAMQSILELVKRVATVNSPVLISGESGAGKEVIAREIWRRSLRAQTPFIPINCGAIPDNLVESELFGHMKGSFTGADADKPGLFETANNGTLFLDEVGELPLQAQIKLLRVLQEQKLRRVGSNQEIPTNARLLFATNRDLQQSVRTGKFREDLYYRINVVEIVIPPLRERRDDIVPLAEHFALRVATRYGISFHFSPDHLDFLRSHSFPGNVRELQNWVERTIILGELSPQKKPHVPAAIAALPADTNPLDKYYEQILAGTIPYEEALRQIERLWLERAYADSSGSQTEAASLLHLSLRQFRYRFENRINPER